MLPFKDKIVKINGWLTAPEGKVLYDLAKNTPRNLDIVEIGSWKGRSTICLGLGSRDGSNATVYAVDPHTGSSEHIKIMGKVDTYQEFLDNLQTFELRNSIVPKRMTSEKASREINSSLSLVFIDGAHEYKYVKQDYRLWFDKVSNGGNIIFHDSWQFPGPNLCSATVLLFSNRVCKPKLIDSMTVIEKTERASFFQRIFNILFVIYRTIFGSKFLLTKSRFESCNTDPNFYR